MKIAASIDQNWIWTSQAEKNGVGKMEPEQWQNLEKILLDAKILQGPVAINAVYTNAYLPEDLPH